ncbi:MAG: hypothetical protein AB7I27_06775 [Bacteriovoracaceae bacterium]
MKYLLILFVVIFFVRIDFFLKLVDRASQKIQSNSNQKVSSSEIPNEVEFIPVSEDKLLKNSSRKKILSLIEDFHSNPIKEIREKTLNEFKTNRDIFSGKLDSELEGAIFRWRDLLIQNNSEVSTFLVDLHKVLIGENQEMIRRFLSILMDLNFDEFVPAYLNLNDPSCQIAKIFGDPIPPEDKLSEFKEREKSLMDYIADDKISSQHKDFANNCLLVVREEIAKLAMSEGPQ